MTAPKTYTEEEMQAAISEKTKIVAKNQELLDEAKSAKKRLAEYDGLDPAEAKQLKQKALDAEASAAAARGDVSVREKQLIEKHTEETRKATEKIAKRDRAIAKRTAEAELRAALAAADADPEYQDLLLLEGERFVKAVEHDDDFIAIVTDAKGNARVADGQGTPFSIAQFVEQDLKAKYPGAFKGTGSSGGGASRAAGGASGVTPKTIAAGSPDFLKHLDKIAKGEIRVVR